MRWARLLAAVFFTWTAGRGLQALLFFENSPGFRFYDAVGTPERHFLYGLPETLAAGITAVPLWRASPRSVAFALVAALVLAVGGVLETADVSANLEIARSSYAASREARGLSTPSPEAMASMFSPGGVSVLRAVGVVLPVGAAILALLGGLDRTSEA